VLDTPAGGDPGDQPERAPVGITAQHDVRPRLADGAQQRVLGRQPGGERQAAGAALERGQRLLQGGAGGVGAPAVLVAAAQATDAVLFVGGREVHRHDHRTGGRVGLLPGVDGAGVETAGLRHGCTVCVIPAR
jgi:hypothetical protein